MNGASRMNTGVGMIMLPYRPTNARVMATCWGLFRAMAEAYMDAVNAHVFWATCLGDGPMT